MDSDSDRELRDVILLLVRACKLWQSRAVASSTALSRIIDLARSKRARLTAEALRSVADQARMHGAAVASHQAASLEQALSGSNEFLEALLSMLQALRGLIGPSSLGMLCEQLLAKSR